MPDMERTKRAATCPAGGCVALLRSREEAGLSHDAWRDALRRAPQRQPFAEVLAGELPSDGLQHAGNAILTVEVDDISPSMVHAVSESLRGRDWDGDVELAQALIE